MTSVFTFIGCGSAFTTEEYYQSNLLIEKNGKKMLIDCGGDARFALAELGLGALDIDAVFVTHCHADHIGGLEWLAFKTCFIPSRPHPELYCMGNMIPDLWSKSLAGGLESVQGKINRIEDYFTMKPVIPNDTFVWEGIEFRPVQTCHVMNGFRLMDSYGLLIRDLDTPDKTLFFTGDTQFAPEQLTDFYTLADVIFHDCETAPFKSRVHAHYTMLKMLPPETKAKMWLYHYQPEPTQDPVTDGFKGFVFKGMAFKISEIG